MNTRLFYRLIQKKIQVTFWTFFDWLKELTVRSGPWTFTGDSKQVIVFVTEQARYHFRLMRFAKWLVRQYPAELILISSDIRQSSDLLEEYRRCFSHFFHFRSRPEYRYILKKYFSHTRLPFHVSTPPNDLAVEVQRLTDNFLFFDPYDVRVIYFGPNGQGCDISWMRRKWIKQDIPDEKKAFESAHGHICRSAENKTAIRKYRYATRASRLFMPDYCDPDSFVHQEPEILPGEWHIVYVGGVASRKAPPSFYAYMQMHRTIETITSRGIHFHVYYAPSQNDDLSDYEAMAKINPRFHWHRPLSQQEMIREISSYHYGIIPFFKEEMGSISPDKFYASTSLKLFNYFEAGLPVLISRDLGHKLMIVRYYQAGLAIGQSDLPQLDKKLSLAPYAALRQNVLHAREQLSLARHISRLYAFYQKVIRAHV